MELKTIKKSRQQPAVLQTKHRKPWYRTAVQILFFALVAIISVNKVLEQAGWSLPLISEASLHAICPFGGVVTIYKFITAGTFVQKIHESSFILMLLAFLLAVGFGPVFCGWICPFGTFQEWLGKIGRKVFRKKYNRLLPSRLDKVLRYTRYIVLALVVYNTAATAKLVFQDIDPYYALFNFWTNEVALSAYIILGITLLLSLIIERPWCKYACPYGALLGIFNLFRLFKIRRNPPTCIGCKKCDKECPMNINVSKKTAIRDHQCISCLKCTSENACPVGETVDLSIKGVK